MIIYIPCLWTYNSYNVFKGKFGKIDHNVFQLFLLAWWLRLIIFNVKVNFRGSPTILPGAVETLTVGQGEQLPEHRASVGLWAPETFYILWHHATWHDPNQESDNTIFCTWAKETGKWTERVDEANPTKWKDNQHWGLNRNQNVHPIFTELQHSIIQGQLHGLRTL